MYIPPSFRIDDAQQLFSFMETNSFATLVTCDAGTPTASHLPVRLFCDQDVCTSLVSHMARANPQWRHFANGSEVLTIFPGPHAYISPSWYEAEKAVPTWNYAAVHVYGRATVMEDHDRVVALLAETIEFYERSFERPWPGILPAEFRDQLIDAIVAFEITIDRIEGNFKLGQNRSTADLENVHHALSQSENANARALAALMTSHGIVTDSA